MSQPLCASQQLWSASPSQRRDRVKKIALIALAMMPTGCGTDPEHQGRIEGFAAVNDDRLEGLGVKLSDELKGSVISHDDTNANGQFSFTNLPVGRSYTAEIFDDPGDDIRFYTTEIDVQLTSSEPVVSSLEFNATGAREIVVKTYVDGTRINCGHISRSDYSAKLFDVATKEHVGNAWCPLFSGDENLLFEALLAGSYEVEIDIYGFDFTRAVTVPVNEDREVVFRLVSSGPALALNEPAHKKK